LEELLKNWSCWDKYKNFYLEKHLPKLQAGSKQFTEKEEGPLVKREREPINNIKKIATPEEWEQLPELARQFIENKFDASLFQHFSKIIENYLYNDFKIDEADEIYLHHPGVYSNYLQRRSKVLERAKQELNRRIDARDLQGATELFERIQKHLSDQERDDFRSELQALELEEERDKKRDQIRQDLQLLLEKGEFREAEDFFRNQKALSTGDYEEMKRPYIEDFINERFGYVGDQEKAQAVAKADHNVLIKARAGSGKTTTIACKTVWLIEKEKVHPDHILVLAFNRKAAEEIGRVIRKRHKAFRNARTFHSLAYQLVLPSQKPLFDDGHGDLSVRNLSEFVKELLKRIWNPIFLFKMYTFFRKELQEIERSGALLSDEERYFYFRNLPEITLNGERVKSRGEKYIADFLFEHDLSYAYEKIWRWGKRPYRPDFTIEYNNKVYVIEHWAIDEQSRASSDEDYSMIDEKEYLREMREKRKFWRKEHHEVIFLETSVGNLQGDREAFEEQLRRKLEDAGIQCRKLPDEVLRQRVKKKHLPRIVELFVQFIQRAKKKRYNPQDVADKIDSIADQRTRVFWELASRVYAEYEKALKRQGRYDFDDLLNEAIQKIHDTKGLCRIKTAEGREVAMNELQWIMIDEYQDFSLLFYDLIQAIHQYNPHVRLFCVGDGWQAINAFAGSDLYYFENFRKLFGQGKSAVATLLTNYRSRSRIVQNGNQFMASWDKTGESSRSLPEHEGGEVIIEHVDDVWLNLKEKSNDLTRDYRFLPKNSQGLTAYNRLLGRYFKKCYEIIAANLEELARRPPSKGKKVAILSRTNRLYGLSLSEFKAQLKSCFSKEQLKILGPNFLKVSTVHSYKGLEATIVIIIEACKRAFPLIHPDSQLFEPLGSTPQKVLGEEQRLFYVAITRAREKLYILTERNRESDFLKVLGFD